MQGERRKFRQGDGIRPRASSEKHFSAWPLLGLLCCTTAHPALAFQRTDPLIIPSPSGHVFDNPELRSNPTADGANKIHLKHAVCTFDPYGTAAGPANSTVSVAALQLPDKAQEEYQSACVAYSEHKLANAEQHLHKALKSYPGYAPGWVMLGKILMLAGHMDEAENACAEGAKVNPESWQAAVCLSEIASQEQKWLASSVESERALALSPDNGRYAAYLDAIALLQLNELPLAEKRAIEALELDHEHRQPAIRLVLARIYELEGNVPAAASQLREFLKDAADSPQADSAKKELALIQDSGN